jgi:hypothetical protein
MVKISTFQFTFVALVTILQSVCFVQMQGQHILKNITFDHYAEFYYSYEGNENYRQKKADFFYNHKENNDVRLNLLLLKAKYNQARIRSTLAIMIGNYAKYNLGNEPRWARFVNEANIGYHVLKQKNVWFELGIFQSHIGFESAISADCWTLTRSIAAENSPYYETGLRLSSNNKKENLKLAFLVLNGWQHIKQPFQQKRASLGVQINYQINKKLLLNYSNFIGNEKEQLKSGLRYFNNLYMQYEKPNSFGIILGFDFGNDTHKNVSKTKRSWWYTPIVMTRFTLNKKLKFCLRGEYFRDHHNIILSEKKQDIIGLSGNFDYNLNKKMMFRAEAKMITLRNKENMDGEPNNSLNTSLCIRF